MNAINISFQKYFHQHGREERALPLESVKWGFEICFPPSSDVWPWGNLSFPNLTVFSCKMEIKMDTPQGKILVKIKREEARKEPGTQVLNMAFPLHFLFHKSSLFKKKKKGVYQYKQVPLECSAFIWGWWGPECSKTTWRHRVEAHFQKQQAQLR